MMTESEAIFAQEAEKRGWDPEKIDEQSVPSGVKTPDFLICGGSVAVEVKQLDPRCDVERGDVEGVMGGVPGKRLRGLIKKANPQLRTLSVPGMLVVQNRTACSLHLDPFAVYSAMSGIETWEMPAVGGIHIIDPERDRLAGHTGATTTRTCNRAISCIAVLCEMYDGRPSVFGGWRTGPGVLADRIPQPERRQPAPVSRPTRRRACDALQDGAV